MEDEIMTTLIEVTELDDKQVAMMQEHEQEMAELHEWIHAEFCGQLNMFNDMPQEYVEV